MPLRCRPEGASNNAASRATALTPGDLACRVTKFARTPSASPMMASGPRHGPTAHCRRHKSN
eukprot:2665820-Lingulodinium_polyedra.AAC.1